jgi:hypothetical protein
MNPPIVLVGGSSRRPWRLVVAMTVTEPVIQAPTATVVYRKCVLSV